MKDFIRALDKRTINIFFGGIYVAALAFALFPPLYLWGSGSTAVILGVPLPIAYWLFNGLVLGLGLWGLYRVEDIRGELDESRDSVTIPVDAPDPAPVAPVTAATLVKGI